VFTVVHQLIVVFNLFGWIPKATRKAHFISILLTAASWFLLGLWYGIGFCPVTEWQWQVKQQLGETNIPPNFIEYITEKVFRYDFDPGTVSIAIAVCFALASLASVYVNFMLPRRIQRQAGLNRKADMPNA
jgi:hypothetical protein